MKTRWVRKQARVGPSSLAYVAGKIRLGAVSMRAWAGDGEGEYEARVFLPSIREESSVKRGTESECKRWLEEGVVIWMEAAGMVFTSDVDLGG